MEVTMNDSPPIVILPTYNERDNLAPIARAILAAEPRCQLLIVDDNSPDGTGAIANALSRESRRVRVLHRHGKAGLGAAYLAGFDYALAHGYEYVVEMDADFSHDPSDLPRLIAPVRAGQADLALGSRWVAGGGTRGWPLRRQALSRGGSLYARTVLRAPIRDLTGGFKCFHRRVLERLDLETVRTSGYGFQIEVTHRALQANFRVLEIPIVFTERARGESKMSGRIVTEALLLVWRLRRARPAVRVAREGAR
jgi:dolichol-phosphate mannosyltransferase